MDSFALLTYQGVINPSNEVNIEGDIGALYSIMINNVSVDGNLYASTIALGGGLTLTGTTNPYNSVPLNAYIGAQMLYQTLIAMPCDANIVCPSQTFTSGVYCYNGSLLLPNPINFTFDARGDPTAVFVISISGGIQGHGGRMNLINGALACNVFVLVHGAIHPMHSASLVGIWLVAGNIESVGDIELTGKVISLGPGVPQLGNPHLLMGQGDISPSGRFNINRCSCYNTPAPTLSPTPAPTGTPTTPTNAPTTAPNNDLPWQITLGVLGGIALLLLCWLWLGRRRSKKQRRYDGAEYVYSNI